MSTEIGFVGYGEDCRVEGKVRLDEDSRLTDLLNRSESITIREVTVMDLRYGTAAELPELEILRSELSAVAGGGPQGDPRRRLTTKREPVEISLNGFQARGFVHGPPAGDAFLAFERRPSMVPITNAEIVFLVGDERVTEAFETLIVNRDYSRYVRRAAEPAGVERAQAERTIEIVPRPRATADRA